MTTAKWGTGPIQTPWQRIVRALRTRTAPRKPREIRVGASLREIAEQIRMRQMPRFFGLIPEQAALLDRFYPHAYNLTIEQANACLEHRFNLFGAGSIQAGNPINWHTDFRSGYRWPVEHHTRLELFPPASSADVCVPWQLNRFYHAVRLGQAYLYTRHEPYAQEIIDQVQDWIEHNPYEFGINWARPMEVAIRAVNWVWAYYCIIESTSLNTNFLTLWLASLQEHGSYLLKHLDDNWPFPGQVLANLAGLIYLGVLFPEFPDSARWRAIGMGRFWTELEQRVYPDGMHSEGSLAYHAFATEIGLGVAALCVVNDIDIPETARARLASMLDVIMTYLQPDGTAPPLGDTLDDHLISLSVYEDAARGRLDQRHLLALGSLVLERHHNEWAGYVNPAERGWSIAAGDSWQDAFWYFASDAAARLTDVITHTTKRPENIPPDTWIDVKTGIRVQARALRAQPITLDDLTGSRGLEASGIYVMRHRDIHMVVDAGGTGPAEMASHAHNDTLSMTLWAYDRPLLIDPGTFLYSSNIEEHNRFRSTAAHNTLQVGDAEISALTDQYYLPGSEAHTTVHRWISEEGFDLLDASHDGYCRLQPGVMHRRQIWFDKKAAVFILHDEVRHAMPPAEGSEGGETELNLWFHLAPLPVRLERSSKIVISEAPTGANLVIMPVGNFPLQPVLVNGWHAPFYGVSVQSPVARFTGRVKLPVDLVVLLYPHDGTVDLNVVRATGRVALDNMRKALAPIIKPGGIKAR